MWKQNDSYFITTLSGQRVLFSAEDWEKVLANTWSHTPLGYVKKQYDKLRNADGKRLRESKYLHRELMNPPSNMVVDHINGNPLDNRRENLRICTQGQNRLNAVGFSKRTKYKGITQERNGKWRAKIHEKGSIDGSFRSLGVRNTPEKAAALFDAAVTERDGEFALTNKMIGDRSNEL